MFSKRSGECADEISASPRNFHGSSQREQHLRLSRKEVYPKVEYRDRARFDELPVRLVRS